METEEIFKKLEIAEPDDGGHEENIDAGELFSHRAFEDSLDFEAGVDELPL